MKAAVKTSPKPGIDIREVDEPKIKEIKFFINFITIINRFMWENLLFQ